MQVTPELMQECIVEVQRQLLTSNDLVLRAEQPFYHSHSSVPPILTEFKVILTELRMYAAKLIHELGVQRIGSMDADFSEGTFFHSYLLGLTIASFGIGECAETTYKLVERLIKKGGRDFLFISLKFPNRAMGMEMSHGLLIANVPNIRESIERVASAATLEELLGMLPENAIVGDAFLGVSYLPKEGFPQAMQDYLAAYGGQECITQVFHFYNFSTNVLSNYQIRAVNIIKRMREEQRVSTQKPLDLNKLTQLSEDTRLLEMLKEKTPLPFIGYRDDDYFVYALSSLNSKSEWRAAMRLIAHLPNGSVTFFRGVPQDSNKQSIAVRKINIGEVAYKIDSYTDTLSIR